MDRPFVLRIQARLGATGKSVRRASIDAGLSETALKDLLANKDQSPKLSTMERLAEALDTDPAWLAFGTGSDISQAQQESAEKPPAFLRVVGEVAAGRWLEADDHVDESAYDPVPITPDPRWPIDVQYGLVVRGTSLNRIAIDGDILACVDIQAARREPAPDELVIVEMRRNSGLLRQRTAKRFEPKADHIELWPDSEDPKWQAPILVPKGEPGLSYEIEDEDGRITVSVIALVTWIHRPIQRRRRS